MRLTASSGVILLPNGDLQGGSGRAEIPCLPPAPRDGGMGLRLAVVDEETESKRLACWRTRGEEQDAVKARNP